MFHVGQKVEYMGAAVIINYPGMVVPERGVVYTVANVYEWLGVMGIELFELPNPETPLTKPGFNARAFRPIVERKTDISIFTAMLTPKKGPANV